MTATRIRLKSITGHPVHVWVYDTAEEMAAARRRFNGNTADDPAQVGGVTQITCRPDGRTATVWVRLRVDFLTHEVVAHEVHHAASAIYNAGIGERVAALTHFSHYNESAAYLFSDLYSRLLVRLAARGFRVQ